MRRGWLGAPASTADEDRALLLLRAMIAAAHADGALDEDERRRIMEGEDGGGAPEAAILADELAHPLDVEELCAIVKSPAAATDVYAASLMAIEVDTGCLAALAPTVDFRIVSVGGIKTQLLGGEGMFLASLTGPGKVWLQSMPYPRLVGHIQATMAGMKER